MPPVVSRYPSCPVWSRCGLLTHLAWACCSRGIHHTWRGLVVVFSHALHGLVVLAVSVTPGMVSSRSSDTPCVGSLFSRYPSRLAWSCRGLLRGGGHSAGSRVERGRSVERDNMRLQSIALSTTDCMCSSNRTTPMGLPSFPLPPKSKRTAPKES